MFISEIYSTYMNDRRCKRRTSYQRFYAVLSYFFCSFVPRNLCCSHALSATATQEAVSALKLMTYNIHAWRDSFHKCNFDRLVSAVKEAKPDILCLNEVLHPFAKPSATLYSEQTQREVDRYYEQVQNGKGRGKSINTCFIPNYQSDTFLHRLAAEANLPNIEFVGATDDSYFGKGVQFGNAILTSHQLLECLHVPLEVESGDLQLGNQPRNFVDPRIFSAAKVLINDDQYSLGVAFGHLDHKSEMLREKQIKRGISSSQSLFKNMPHLLCGDFNTFQKSDCDAHAWQSVLDLYKENNWPAPPEQSLVLDVLNAMGYQDTYYIATEREEKFPKPTAWTHKPIMRIDHILAKNFASGGRDKEYQIVPRRHYRLKIDASDHFPVVLEFDLQSMIRS